MVYEILVFSQLAGNQKEKDSLAEGVRMQNLENKLFPVLQRYVEKNFILYHVITTRCPCFGVPLLFLQVVQPLLTNAF